MSREIRLSEVLHQAGLDGLANPDLLEVDEFMTAAVTGLADGDIAGFHGPYTGKRAELYGPSQYSEGKVASAILRAALENGREPGSVYDFQVFAADYYNQPAGPFGTLRYVSSVRIYPEAVMVDDNPLALARPPKLVVDYGACVGGSSYIADQIGFIKQRKQPFTYSPLTRLPFINHALMNRYDRYASGATKLATTNRFYVSGEDGVGAATDEILRAQRAHGAPTEVADIIICLESHHMTSADLRRGMENSFPLLREGGALVIRSLARPATDELGAEEIAGWAFEAGFQEKDAVRYAASGALAIKGLIETREARTVVLTK
jgi:hypothetical protein